MRRTSRQTATWRREPRWLWNHSIVCNIEVILQTIENWPIDEQVALARTILERAAMGQRRTPQEQSARSTWDALYGIASNGQEPPTDEQVAQWLEERQDR